MVLGQGPLPGVVSLRDELDAPPAAATETVGPDDLPSIQDICGTTGSPKGCVLTHASMRRLGSLPEAVHGITERDVLLTAQPYPYLDLP